MIIKRIKRIKMKKFKIWYILVLWLVYYLLLSAVHYVQLRNDLSRKYGMIANKMRTTYFINDSILIDTVIYVAVLPICYLIAGAELTNSRGSNLFKDYTYTTFARFKAPFMSKTFDVKMKNGKIIEDTFYDTIVTDSKFNHLYSEWVKKKIRCEDENVELEFDLARDKHNSVQKKISIDFSSIVDVNNIEEEICRNIKNYVLYSIDKKNLDKSNKLNFLNEAKIIKAKFYNDIISNNYQDILWENINIKLYYYDVDLAFDRYNDSFANSNEDNFYYVRFGLKDNTIKYLSNEYDNTWIMLSSWLKDIE